MKKCRRCGLEGENDLFRIGGWICKKCHRKQIMTIQKSWKRKPQGFYYNIKCSAKQRNVQFSIDRINFIAWWNEQEQKCIYCKREPNKIKENTARLTIDRIDNNKGYTLNNIGLACFTCNKVKGNVFTKEDMKIIGKLIRKKLI